MTDEARATIRVDKWLWHARFFKSRSLAAKAVSGGLRVNGERIDKPSRTVGAGDVLTFALGTHVRVVKVLAPGHRRGPAPEARALYEDLTPEAGPETESKGARPTKKDRRAIDAMRQASTDQTPLE